VGLALLDLPASSPARASLREAELATQRAAELARQMLAYSGKGRFVVQSVRLAVVVEEMMSMLQVSISKKAIMRFSFMEHEPAIEADVTQLRQIVLNLVTNASDAIGDRSGVISVSTGVIECDRAYLTTTWLNDPLAEGFYAYLEVADSGCGMTREQLPKIFDPFFTTKFTGRGLGLAAVLGIVRGHKGAIKVYSEIGKGTTFKVLFPVCGEATWMPAGRAAA
jgi:signal transduction histidine kinase